MTIRTSLRQPWTTVLLAALLVLVLGGCGNGGSGGGGGDADAEASALLDKAFATPIPSADVDADLQLDVKGLAGFEDPLRVRASGPYVRQEKSLPKLDLDVALETQGAGQAIQVGVLSTGDRLFVKFGGAFYEQPADKVASTNRRLRSQAGKGGSLSDLGLNARDWVVDASIAGEEQIDGVATEHVEGTLDVEAALTDINGLVKREAGALGSGAKAARPLGKREIERLAKAVDDPTFDVYVGKDDDIVRRVSLRIDVDVPERDRKDVGGVTGASIRFTAQLDDVGGDQEVEPPRDAQPLSNLTSQLGSLSALTGGVGGGDSSTTTPAPGADGSTGSGDGAGLDDFERYGDCLDAADPDDGEAIARCRSLLP